MTLNVLPFILTAENIQGTQRGAEHEHQYLSQKKSQKDGLVLWRFFSSCFKKTQVVKVFWSSG